MVKYIYIAWRVYPNLLPNLKLLYCR